MGGSFLVSSRKRVVERGSNLNVGTVSAPSGPRALKPVKPFRQDRGQIKGDWREPAFYSYIGVPVRGC